MVMEREAQKRIQSEYNELNEVNVVYEHVEWQDPIPC